MDHSETDLYLARLVRANLAAANHRAYPQTPEEWNEVARRLGVTAKHDAQFSFGAMLLDDLMLYGAGTPEQMARWFAHELAESRLRCECEPPFILLDPEDAYHRISRLVESLDDP